MNVTYVIGFSVRTGERQRFLDLLHGVLDAMRNEGGFRGAILNVDPQDPDRFLLHETWADHQDVVDVQLQRPYRRAWHDALPDLLERPRDLTIWRPLRLDFADTSPNYSSGPEEPRERFVGPSADTRTPARDAR